MRNQRIPNTARALAIAAVFVFVSIVPTASAQTASTSSTATTSSGITPTLGTTTQKMMPVDATTTYASSCPPLSRALMRGMRDSGAVSGDIIGLQKFLAAYFGTKPEDIATGYFGPVTEAHVIRLQAALGLSQLGIVGPLTRAAIFQACTQNPNPNAPKISLTAPAATSTVYAKGDDIPVMWTTSGVAANTGMYLQLASLDGEVVKSITVPYASGTARLGTKEFCNSNFSDAIYGACENISELLQNGPKRFKILAALYTPKDACFGFCAPAATTTTILARAESAEFMMEDPDAGRFTASSTKGKAPLTTTFMIKGSGSYILDYGDGSDKDTVKIQVPPIMCVRAPCLPPPHEEKHTYRKTGIFYATLKRVIENECKPTSSTVCAAWTTREETIGTITIEATRR